MRGRYTPIVDISDGTNLLATAPIVLTNDTLSLNQSGVDHGSISGLGGDDHTQYILASGTRALTGNWGVGGYNFTNVGTIGCGAITSTGSSTFDTDTLVVDAVNHRVGIGIAAPATAFNIGNGGVLQVNSAGDDKNVQLYHDDSNAYLVSSSGSIVNNSASGKFIIQHAGSSIFNIIGSTTKDQCQLTLEDNSGNQIIISNDVSSGQDFDHAVQTNPTLYVHSDLDPDISNNQWGSFVHDQENFIITSGANTGAGSAPTTDENAILLSPRGTEELRVATGGVTIVNDLVVDTDTLVVDAVNHRVGVNLASPVGEFHVYTGASGQGSVDASANELVIESSGNAGLSILTPSANVGGIFFGDPSNTKVGQIRFDHTVNKMQFQIINAADFIGNSLVMGADVSSITERTNATRKLGRFLIPHYLIAEENVIIFVGDSDGTNNILNFGDGTALGNKPTEIRFSVDVNDTTTGTGAANNANMYINSSGDIGINTITQAAKLHVVGTSRFGDQATNYTAISATGDVSFVGSAGFYPRFLTQSAEPAAGTGATQCDTSETIIWKDSDDNKIYLCFNDGGTVKTVELA